MNRRRYIATIGTSASVLSLAGCSSNGGGDDGGGDGNSTTDQQEQGPLYEESDKEDMLLSVDDFPDGWTGTSSTGQDGGDRDFTNDAKLEYVTVSVNIYGDVAAAEDEFEQARAGFFETNDYPIGDEAFWATRNPGAFTMFRHSNADGRVVAGTAGVESGPNQANSQEYAEVMYEKWENL